MDRRSWLWRRRTSDKSPGETDSSGSGSGSGSISSPSERFSDEQQQPYSTQNAQSPEVTSKVASHDEDVNDSVKILSEKLSDALASVNAKEELVKQHAKVAEEAVSGWEKAEEEVVTLKQQLEVATTKNKSLEERVIHLDGALKECLRQSRLVKEEYDQKIQEVISKRTNDTDSINSEYESQISDLRAQLEMAKAKAEAATSSESDIRLRLDSIIKENTSLQLELRSRLQDLEIMSLERDLSTKTAETASKQHLESIKKVAKLEAECRRLKTLAFKATSFSEKKTYVAASTHVDSASNSSNALLGQIGLMDDFLEMEKFAALPVQENRSSSSSLGSVISAEKLHEIGDDSLRAEFDAMMKRTVELEEKAKALESEKVELGSTLTRCKDQVKVSETRTMQLQSRLNECQNQLKISQAQLSDANKKLAMLQAELDLANELRQAIELELEDANLSREESMSKLRAIEDESKILLSKIDSLENEAEKERSLYAEASSKCRTLEDELSRMRHENARKEMTELQLEAAQSEIKSLMDKISALENEAEMERRVSSESAAKCRKLEGEISRMKHKNAKKETIESQLEAAQSELKSLTDKISALKNEAELERRVSLESATKCRKLEDELSRMKHEIDIQKSQLVSVNDSKEAEVKSLMDKISALENEAEMERRVSEESASKCKQLEDELSRKKHEVETWKTRFDSVNGSKEVVESQLVAAYDEAKSLLAKVCSLEGEVKKERAISAEFAAKCKTLEIELSKIKFDVDLRPVPLSKEELDSHQEKEMAIAATKLAECQKTIASLGQQLKTLASFDDFFLDSDKLIETDTEPPHRHSNKVIVPSDSDSLTSKTVKDVKEGFSSSTSTVDKSHKNGIGKLFFQSKGVMRSQDS